MLKILQASLQQYVNCELPTVQVGFRKGKGTKNQIANIHWIIKNLREFQKSIYFCFIDYTKTFDCVDHKKLWKILQEMGKPDHQTCLLRICMQVRKQQLELVMEQQTGSKWEKEYVKTVYCHPAYLTYMQSTPCEMPGEMKHKLESRLPGEFHGQRSLEGYSPWGCKELDMLLLLLLLSCFSCVRLCAIP